MLKSQPQAEIEGIIKYTQKTPESASVDSGVFVVRPACIQSNRWKSSARPIAGSAQPKTRVSVARQNLKEVCGKRLA